MSYAANPNKPKKDKAETDAAAAAKQEKSDRERIRRLIITLGDENKKVVGQIKGLVAAVEDDVEPHGELMADTVLECAKSLPMKTTIFGAWVGRMLEKYPAWGASVVGRALEELRAALAEGRPTTAQLLLRFFVCLGNAGSVPLPQVLGLLRQVLALSEGLRPAKGGDFGVFVALSSLLFLSPGAWGMVKEKVDELVASAQACLASRDAAWKPLLRLFKGEALPDRLEALASAVQSIRQASWSSQAIMHVPGFEACLEAKNELPPLEPLGLTAEDVKKSRFRLQVPLIASRLLSAGLDSDGADDALSEHDRWVLEDCLLATIEMFSRDVEECGKQILRIPLVHPHFEAIVVETIFSQMLRLPSPAMLPLFYTRLLETLAEKQASILPITEQAYKALFEKVPDLDEECSAVLSEAFAYRLTHNSYAADWGPFTGESVAAQSQRFLRRSFERLQRLSFHQNLLHRLPEAVHVYVPPEPLAANSLDVQKKTEFAKMLGYVKIKDPDEQKALRYCRLLLQLQPAVKEEEKEQQQGGSQPPQQQPAAKLEEEEIKYEDDEPSPEKRPRDEEDAEKGPEAKRRKGEEAPAVPEAEKTLEDEFGGSPDEPWSRNEVAELFTAALLQNGAKTPTHLSKVLDGYEKIFAELRPEGSEEAAHGFARAVVRCVFDFWRLSGQRLEITLDSLLVRGVVTPRAVVEEALAQRGPFGCDSVPVWSSINSVARKSLESSQSVRGELALAKREGGAEELAVCRRRLDAAVQETAELFTQVFAGLVRHYQEVDEEDDPLLKKVTLDHILNIGRKYHAFIKPLIDTAESRIPGVSQCPDVAAVFASLRAL